MIDNFKLDVIAETDECLKHALAIALNKSGYREDKIVGWSVDDDKRLTLYLYEPNEPP